MKKNISSRTKVIFLSILFVIISFFSFTQSAEAASRFSVTSDNWNSTATWSETSGGAGGASVPVASDNVTIEGGHNVTVTENAAAASITFTTTTATSLTINSGITLDVSGAITIPRPISANTTNLVAVGAGNLNTGSISFTSGGTTVRHQVTISTGTVTVTGNVVGTTVSASVVFTDAGIFNVGGTFLATGTLTPSTGTIVYNGAGAQTITTNGNYNNLILSGGGTKTSSDSAPLVVNGNLAIGNNVTFSHGISNLTITGTTTIGSGTGGTLSFSSTTGTKTFGGLVTINGGATWDNSTNENVTFRGGITNNGTFTEGGIATHTFDTNSQALTGNFSIPSISVNNVTLTNNNTLTVSTLLSVSNGDLTQASNSTLNIGGSSSITTLNATASGNTVNYTGANQTVKATTYNNLTLSGSGVKSMATGISTSGNLSIAPTGSATASIGAGLNLTINSLTLGSLGRINGEWGSSTSAATYQNNTYFAATTGKLTVTTDTRSAPTITTPPTASGITYDQALSSSTLSGGSASVAGTFTFTTPSTIPNAGTFSAPVTFTPTDASTYLTTTTNVDVLVAQAPSTTLITCPNPSETYAGSPITPCSVAVTGAGGLSLTPTASYTNNTNVGTASVNYIFVGDANHTGSSDTENFNITTLAITVTADSNTKVYNNSTDSTGAPTISPSLVGTDTSGFIQTFDNANVGTGKTLTPSGTVNDGNSGNNYSVTFVPASTGTINTLDITVTANAKSKTYGDSDPILNYGVTGSLLGGDVLTGELSRVPGEDVGTYAITQGTVALGTNYNLIYVGNNLSISPQAVMNITANNQSITYGDSDPSFTFAYSGSDFKNGDDVSVIDTPPTCSVSGIYANVGSYAIICSGGSDNNYSFNYNSGTLTVNPKPLVVTANSQTKVYGDTDPAFTYTHGSLAFSDTDSVFTGSLGRTVGENVGTQAITIGTLAAGANYTLTLTSANLTITARPLTVSAATDTKEYDLGVTSSGVPTITSGTLVGTDSTNFSQVFSDKNAGTGKNLIPSGTINDTNGGLNYSLTFANNTTGVITAKNLTVSVAGVNKAYDGTTNATITILSDDRLTGDVFNTSYTTAVFADSNVGTAKTISISGISKSGVDAGNYNLVSTTSTTANITKIDATISVVGYTGTFNNSPHGATGTATGILGENLSASFNLGSSFTAVPGGIANWTFTDNNYNDASGSVTITINSRGQGRAASPSSVSSTNISTSSPASITTSTTQSSQVLGAQSFRFSLKSQKGARGSEVTELQKFLNVRGYNAGLADGIFGAKVKAAVIRFQIANNLKGDGVVGPKVRALMNK